MPHMRITCFKKTTDDWRGNFLIGGLSHLEGDAGTKLLCADGRYLGQGFVQVELTQLQDKQYLVNVWGNDDFGMDIVFPADQLEKAKAMYCELALVDSISNAKLTELGFQWH